MYVHVGAGKVERVSDIIGIFDIDGKRMSDINIEYLKKTEKRGKTVMAGNDLPRTFIVTDKETVLTHISSGTVLSRIEKIQL